MTDHRAEADQVIDELYQRMGEASPQPRLWPTRRAVELLGDPQQMFGVVHLTGSNGKTSTARLADALLRAHGLRTGLMTSPHLERLNERIMIDGEPVSDDALVANYRDIDPVLTMVDAELLAGGEAPLTFFETLTVLTLACFADAPVDVAVLEVGMGGEWDATNVAHADVAVFTPIALEHVEVLGPTVVDIAKTKSGIIKPASRVVTALQSPDVFDVLQAAADHNESPMTVVGRDVELLTTTPGVGGQVVDFRLRNGEYRSIPLPLFGLHQADNAVLAAAAVEQFLGGGEQEIARDVVEDALARSTSPGRLQVVSHQPTVIIDAAHNPHGAESLARALMQSFQFETLVVVLGVLRDKDARGIVEALDPLADMFVVTQSESDRAVPAEDLAEAVLPVAGPDRTSWRENVVEAIELAQRQAGPHGGVVVTGSVTLIAEALEWAGR